MKNLLNSAQTLIKTNDEDVDICGCMTFGGIVFIMSALMFLSTNNAAQAFINVAQ